jgi:bacteriophage tail fiber protein
MSTNQLLPFANGTTPNVLDYASWNALAARQTGFQSGIASSQQFNYILAQGGAAGYTIGQLVADYAHQDATLNATTLYTAFKQALAAFVPQAVADNAINGSKLSTGTVTGAKLAANSVDASKIVNGSVGTAEIGDNAITFGKMNVSAIATDGEASAGTATNKLMTPKGVAAAITQLSPACPTGMIAFFALKNIPDGWLLCNGANVSRTDYAALFAAIGTIYGTGDGVTTFGLPNMGGRFLEGTTYTGSVGTYHSAGLPNITGKFGASKADSQVISGAFSNTGYLTGADGKQSSAVQFSFTASSSDSTFGRSSGVQPPAIALLPCIKS